MASICLGLNVLKSTENQINRDSFGNKKFYFKKMLRNLSMKAILVLGELS